MSDFNDPGNPNNQFPNGGNGEPFQSNTPQYQQNPYAQNPYTQNAQNPYMQNPQDPQTQQYGQQYSQPYGQQTAYTQPQQSQPQQPQPQQNQQQAYGWQQPANGQPQYAQYQQPYQQPNQTGYNQQAYDQYAYSQMPNPNPYPASQTMYAPEQKSKLAAGLLGIFLGSLGIHNFYLGNTGKAVAQLLLTVIGCLVFIGPVIAGIWGLVEGILILCSSYGSSWHRDAKGIELRD